MKDQDLQKLFDEDFENPQQEDTQEYAEVPAGEYVVTIKDMDLKNKKNSEEDKLLFIQFKLKKEVDGNKQKYGGACLFYYNPMNYGKDNEPTAILKNLKRGFTFMNSLLPHDKQKVFRFTTIDNLKQDIISLFNQVSESYEYKLKYDKTESGFKTFKIEDIFAQTEEELPFN